MKQSRNKIAVITVNFNNPEDTIACIKSFLKVSTNDDIVFYIVNNGCTDNSDAQIAQTLRNTKLIKSPVNLGFAGGNNLAIREALKNSCTHILLINNDAQIMSANFFDSLLKSPFDLTSASLVTSGKKHHQIDYGGLVDWYFGRNTHRYNTGKIDYISGACFFAKSEVFQKVGLLDDHFFLYYEDVDYCLRTTKLGFTLGILPEIKIKHSLSASTNKLGSKKLRIIAQSHLRFCLKHLSIFAFPLYFGYNLYLRFKSLFP